MLKIKKLLCLALVILIALTGAVGCAKPATAPAPAPAPAEAAKTPALEPVELTWYFIGNGQQEDVKLIEEEANKYLKDKINATIKLQCYQWGAEYDDKLKQMIASRQEFDICFTAAWANNYMQNAVKGAFVALNDSNDLLNKYAPKTKALLGDDFLAGSQIDGINYGIPANKEKAHAWGFIIKKDLVDKYGFDLSTIKTLQDLEPMLKVIKEKETNVYGLEALDGESPIKLLDWDVVGDDKCPGVVYNDSKDLKVFNEFAAPETMELLKTMRKFYQAGYIRKDAATVTDYNADEAAGKIFAATKSLKPGKDAEMSLTHGFEWVQVYITSPVISSRDTMGSLQAVSSTSKHAERALMFLELFNTDPYLNNLINYGIVDKHYAKVSDSIVKAGPDQKKYNPGTGWMFGNQFINYLYESEDPKKWEQFGEFNKQATGTQTLGFNFDPSSVKSEIAAINNLWDKYVPALETGSIDPEKNVPKFLEEMKAAGIDKVIAEKQKQLDAWAKKVGK
ncbi:MAG: ABC transporter substrate-binding protein [Clostridia bacterium]